MVAKRDLLRIVSAQLDDCGGYLDGDTRSEAHKLALDYYYMRPRGDEVPGRSQVVDGSVSAMTEAVASQMLDAFMSPNLVSFDPEYGDDTAQAALETDAITYIVMGGPGGFVAFAEAVKDALLHDNGIIKVWLDDRSTERERVYRNVTAEAYAELMRDRRGVRLEKIEWKRGTLRYSELRSKKKIRISSVAPENFFFTAEWHDHDLDRIPMLAERHVETRGQLAEWPGFDPAVIDKLTPVVDSGTVSTARNRKGSTAPRNRAPDRSLDVIEWYESYPLVKNERRKVCFVPNRGILRDEPAPIQPYSIGTAIIAPHRVAGVSLFTKVKQSQDSRTAFKRSLHDNANAANKSRTVFLEGKANQDDLEDGRVNGNIGVTGVMDVRQAVAALVVPDISAGILANLENEKRDRAELGGAALDMASGQAQIADRVGSQGVDRVYSVMEQLAGTMTRTIAETLVRPVYAKVHAMAREYLDEPITLKHKGQWISVNPAEWSERERMTVKVGLSPGQRRRLVESLTFILNTQIQLAQQGMTGVLVSMPTFHATLMDWANAAEVNNADRYYVDPSSDESQKAQAERAKAAAGEKAAQQRLMDMALGLEQMRVALEKRNADADRVLEYFKAILTAEGKEAEIVGKATTEFELARRKADELAAEHEHGEMMLEGVERATATIREVKAAAK
jgi:hypothetical protein